MERFNPNIPIRVGLTAYVAVVMIGLMSYFFYKAMFASMFFSGVIGVFYICLVLMLAIWSGIAYRSNNHNVISFSHAFLAVYIVFACSCLGHSFSTLLVYKLIDKDFPQKIYEINVQKAMAAMELADTSPEVQKKTISDIKRADFEQTYATIFSNLGVMLAATALFSLLVALFIKRSSEDLIRMNAKNTISG